MAAGLLSWSRVRESPATTGTMPIRTNAGQQAQPERQRGLDPDGAGPVLDLGAAPRGQLDRQVFDGGHHRTRRCRGRARAPDRAGPSAGSAARCGPDRGRIDPECAAAARSPASLSAAGPGRRGTHDRETRLGVRPTRPQRGREQPHHVGQVGRGRRREPGVLRGRLAAADDHPGRDRQQQRRASRRRGGPGPTADRRARRTATTRRGPAQQIRAGSRWRAPVRPVRHATRGRAGSSSAPAAAARSPPPPARSAVTPRPPDRRAAIASIHHSPATAKASPGARQPNPARGAEQEAPGSPPAPDPMTRAATGRAATSRAVARAEASSPSTTRRVARAARRSSGHRGRRRRRAPGRCGGRPARPRPAAAGHRHRRAARPARSAVGTSEPTANASRHRRQRRPLAPPPGPGLPRRLTGGQLGRRAARRSRAPGRRGLGSPTSPSPTPEPGQSARAQQARPRPRRALRPRGGEDEQRAVTTPSVHRAAVRRPAAARRGTRGGTGRQEHGGRATATAASEGGPGSSPQPLRELRSRRAGDLVGSPDRRSTRRHHRDQPSPVAGGDRDLLQSAACRRARAPGAPPRSTADASWLCAAARSRPAASASASTRAGTSSAELACRVPQPPSWPVLRAASRSTTSAPRTSPTTSRSGSHPQRLPHQRAHGDRARTLDVGRPRLERDHVRVGRAQLGGVLDDDQPLGAGHRGQQRREQRGLAGARCRR